jgi:multidrug efflux system membrane fusion protein
MDDQPSGPLSAPPHEREHADPDWRAPSRDAGPIDTRSGRHSALWLVLVLLVVAGLVAWVVLRAGHQAAPAGRFQSTGPMPVGTAKVGKGDMPITLSGLGAVTPLAMVTVKTQIAGQLTDVAFTEGQIVNKGDFLAQIDPRPYQVALEQAEGQLAKDQALLKNAELDLTRYKTLVAENSVARQILDTQAALVQQDRGTVQADQAQVDTQKLNLVYCHIIAPVGGRVGLRQVDAGNYVQTSDANGIVVITQLQPISVIFTLPEDNLPAVLNRLHADAKLPVTAYDRTGATKLGSGTLATVDNQIDPTTGTVKLRAVFDNPEQTLFPNQFVNISLLVDTLHDASIVPISAIQRGAPGTFVYLVNGDTVAAQPVSLGPSDNLNVAITKGLTPDQAIVTDGADRLKDGAKVKLVDPGAPAAATPAPAKGKSPGKEKPRSGG